MNKSALPLIIILCIFLLCSMNNVFAQETNFSKDEQGLDTIIDEALDQVEGHLDSSIEVDPSLEPSNDELLDSPIELLNIEIDSKPNELSDIEIPKEMIDQKDKIPNEVIETKIIPLLHAEASSIVETLNQMKSFSGEVSYSEEDRTIILKDQSKQLEAMAAYVKEVDILLETEIFTLEFANASEIIGDIKKLLTENVGQAEFDERANSIVATDTPLRIGIIKDHIKQIDQLNIEVLIETEILQIILNDEHTMGVDWEAIVSDYQKLTFPGFTFNTELPNGGQLNMGVISQEDYKILLEALDTVGIVQKISDEQSITESELSKTVHILSTQLRELQGEGSGEGRTINSDETLGKIYQHEQVNYQLTSSIDREGIITVFLKPQLFGGNLKSQLSVANKSADIKVEDGMIVVIGSLFEEVMVESAWKIPLLGDLPLLGFVFRNQGEVPRKAEIITFLTIKTLEKKE